MAFSAFFFLSALSLDTRSSKINILANVRPKVIQLAELHTLLTQNVVSSGHVEEEVRHQPSVDVSSSGDVNALAGAETDGDGRLVAAVDGGLVGAVDDGGDLVDAGVEVGEGLEVVLEGLGGGAAEAGDGLLGGLGWVVSEVSGLGIFQVVRRTLVIMWIWKARGSMSGWRRVSGNSEAFSEASDFLRMAFKDSSECLAGTMEAS